MLLQFEAVGTWKEGTVENYLFGISKPCYFFYIFKALVFLTIHIKSVEKENLL